MFPKIAYRLNAESWFSTFIFFTRTLLLDAWIGPIKNPITSDKIKKIQTFSTQKSKHVTVNRLNIHIITVFKDPILSSNLPIVIHPTIPKRFIKTPKNKIWDYDNPNRNAENILAKAKIEMTALLKKK